jgi:hypothetical protein
MIIAQVIAWSTVVAIGFLTAIDSGRKEKKLD